MTGFLFDFVLFLGFPVDAKFEHAMRAADPEIVALFFHSRNGEYLTETVYEGVRYIGKSAGEISATVDLKLLENNIYSILKKVIPNYPYDTVPLILFPLPKV